MMYCMRVLTDHEVSPDTAPSQQDACSRHRSCVSMHQRHVQWREADCDKRCWCSCMLGKQGKQALMWVKDYLQLRQCILQTCPSVVQAVLQTRISVAPLFQCGPQPAVFFCMLLLNSLQMHFLGVNIIELLDRLTLYHAVGIGRDTPDCDAWGSLILPMKQCVPGGNAL